MTDKPSPKGKKKSKAKVGALKRASKGASANVKGGSLVILESRKAMAKTARFRVVGPTLGDAASFDKFGSGGALFEDGLSIDKG